ncbi:MAG: tetratricopeptide repeat protein, partial [bacterium]|nr:tetratricopeptide repeat protein [bacterium]
MVPFIIEVVEGIIRISKIIISWPKKQSLFQARARLENFVGRTEKIKSLTQSLLIRRKSIVVAVIQCMPGVGKTTLANELAHKLRKRFPDGVLWIQASSDTSPVEHILQVGASLKTNLQDYPTLEGKSAALRDLLKGKRLLLIIDNAEKVEDVKFLMPNISPPVILVTTRNYNLSAALDSYSLNLECLHPNESLRLLSKCSGREWYNEEEQIAKEICEILGHLPLAIEIAGKRLKRLEEMSFKEYFSEIRANIQNLLSHPGGNENISVKSSFDSSYSRLSPRDQEIFAALGVFGEQDFGSEAVSAVTGIEKVQEHLDNLVDLSLLKYYQGRYNLHPLMRQYAQIKLNQLTNDLQDKYKRGCYTYFMDLVKESYDNFNQLKQEITHIRMSLDYCKIYEDHQQFIDLTLWLIGLHPEMDSETVMPIGYLSQMDWSMAIDLCEKTLDHCQSLYLRHQAVLVTRALIFFHYWLGHHDECQSYIKHARQYLREDDDWYKQELILILQLEAYLQDDENDYDKANQTYKRALELSLELEENYYLKARSHHLVGDSEYHKGLHELALRHFEEALQIVKKFPFEKDKQSFRANTLRRLGGVLRKLERYNEAKESLEESLKIETNFRNQARCLRQLSKLSLSIFEKQQHRPSTNRWSCLGKIFRKIVRYRIAKKCLYQAKEDFEKAKQIFEKIKNQRGLGGINFDLGEVHRLMGKNKQALTFMEKSARIASKLHCPYGEGVAYRGIGNLHYGMGERDKALERWEQAEDFFRKINSCELIDIYRIYKSNQMETGVATLGRRKKGAFTLLL